MHQTEANTVAGGLPPGLTVDEVDVARGSSDPHSSSKSEHFKDWPNDLAFNYFPQTNEPKQLAVSGKFPSWTAGTLLRVGPGLYKTPTDSQGEVFEFDHWFDGFTTIHRFEIRSSDNETTDVIYSSRGLMDVALEKARKTKRFEPISFGQKYDPCDSLYRKVKTFFTPQPSKRLEEEAVNVSFSPSYHRPESSTISLTTDKAVLKEIDVETLEPKSLTSQKMLHPRLFGDLSAAHPCIDPVSGDLFNYNLAMGPAHFYHIFRTNAGNGSTDILATLMGPHIRGAYIHSLLLTENFVILCIWPAFYGNKGLNILWKRNLLEAIEPFDPKAKCTWYVIDRRNNRGVVKTLSSPAMFCFHTVNAWEVKNASGEVDIIADLCQFENLDVLHRFYYDNLVSNGRTVNEFSSRHQTPVSLVRYKLGNIPMTSRPGNFFSRDTASVLWSLKEPHCGDLPRINDAYYTKPYRYVYSILVRGLASFADAIGKTDTKTGECKIWSVDKHTPGEPVFIARPGAIEEDDGVLLIVVLDGIKGTSYLLCLDARDLSEVARADVPVPVTLGFHGIHLPKKRN